jgi:hypothetical protein
MLEYLKSVNSVLIDATPRLVSEAFVINPELTASLGVISKESHDETIDELFRKKPFTDDHRDAWLLLLGESFLGYAIQQRLIDKKNVVFPGTFVAAVQSQLAEDATRWGDTWKKRTIEGQLERSYAEFTNYKDKYKNAGQPFPWLKVAGDTIINTYRIDNPDYQQK